MQIQVAKLNLYHGIVSLVNSRTDKYQKIIYEIEDANNKLTESYLSKNAIPNLLNEIMFIVPKEVQILSIRNATDKHIIIDAQSQNYQDLGYLKSSIQTQGYLTNVTSTSGTKASDSNYVKVTIEGDLPY